MRRRERVRIRLAARSVVAPAVADPGDDPGLVVRDPMSDAVAETRRDGLHIFRERIDRIAWRPATGVLEHLRGIPVEEGDVRRDAVSEQLVDELVVEVEPGF